jgi:mono/diheme cytochrome c family protein
MLKRLCTLALLCGFLAACQSQKTPEALGKAYVSGFGCLTCHRVGNEGGTVGPDLTFIGFRKSPEWLDLWLKDPHAWKPDTNMPNFHIRDDIRKAMVAYMMTLKGQDYLGEKAPWNAASLKDDTLKRGETIFNRVGCSGCHGTAGAGGYPNNNVVGGKIPSLKFVSDGYSKEELVEKITKGVPQSDKEDPNGPAPMLHMPSWGQVLKKEEIEALADYLISLKPASSGDDSWGN